MSWGGSQQPPFNPNYSQGQPPSQQQYRPPAPPHQGYSAPPPQGYGAPPPQGYSAPPPQGYGTPQHSQQGYRPPQQPGQYGVAQVPPGADPTLWHWFQAVDADHNGSISATELQQALLNNNWTHFNNETCRLMISMFDTDCDGTISFNEFSALWKYIQDWKGCFERFDQDRSGNIDAAELRTALATFGFNVSPTFCNLAVTKFDRSDVRTIKLDNFIQCCVMIRSLTEAFKRKDTAMRGTIKIQYEEFLEMVLSNGVK